MRLALARLLLRRELVSLERRLDRTRFDATLSHAIDRVRAALEALGAR